MLSIATDKECEERRQRLIDAGIIKPSVNLIKRRNKPAVSTEQSSKFLRNKLIAGGLIYSKFVEISPLPRISGNEEGEYHATSIKNDTQYDRKLNLYFRALQEILRARKELGLNLEKKKKGDPDWVF